LQQQLVSGGSPLGKTHYTGKDQQW